jgi:1-acyl-sn-glycerol-3-phosphate acyltransferase
MSNHRSNFDVLVLITALWDFQLRWVAKEELARIPGFGWALKATKQIFINRRDHAAAVASLERARERVQSGISVVFFPEGTRSEHGMLPFKKGGFVFAIETGTPIVPIGITGTASILPRNGWLVRRGGTVRVVIQPPIPTAHLTVADRDHLLAAVERAIGSCCDGAGRAPVQPAVRVRPRPPRPRPRTPAPAGAPH